jgi:hypothetical protein
MRPLTRMAVASWQIPPEYNTQFSHGVLVEQVSAPDTAKATTPLHAPGSSVDFQGPQPRTFKSQTRIDDQHHQRDLWSRDLVTSEGALWVKAGE